MARHGFSDNECDDSESQWRYIRYQGQVSSAIRGKRGQEFFVALVQALDAMPVKRLIASRLECDGEVCALGALGRHRGLDMKPFELSDEQIEEDDSMDTAALGEAFGVAEQLAATVMWQNDECSSGNPEERWRKMRTWAVMQIRPETLLDVTP